MHLLLGIASFELCADVVAPHPMTKVYKLTIQGNLRHP